MTPLMRFVFAAGLDKIAVARDEILLCWGGVVRLVSNGPISQEFFHWVAATQAGHDVGWLWRRENGYCIAAGSVDGSHFATRPVPGL